MLFFFDRTWEHSDAPSRVYRVRDAVPEGWLAFPREQKHTVQRLDFLRRQDVRQQRCDVL
jgi:hypothetical protein